MCCKNSNKAVTWSMFWSASYGVVFSQTIQAVQADGAQLRWGLSSPLDKDCPFWSGFMVVVHVEQYSGVVSFHYLPIIDMNPTGLNCIYSTLWFTVDVYPGQTGWLSRHHEWSWCHWIYHGWFWFSKSFWGKSVRQRLFNTSCLASRNSTLRASNLIFADINHFIATVSCTLSRPLKAKQRNPAHLHESQITENHNVTDEDLGLFTQAMSLSDDLSTGRIPPLLLSNTSDSWTAWQSSHIWESCISYL